MAVMMLLPMVVGAMAAMINGWSGFIEAAFMDMTLTLEDFDYRFGPAECGAWTECGNATFDSYQRSRDLAFALFVIALIAVAIKDMIRGGLDVNMGAVDTKTLPEMLKYSVLVFAFLFIFPPIWDVAAGLMNNVGVWVLNPHYDLASRGEYTGDDTGNMCVGDITYDELAELAPYTRDMDAWVVYREGTGPQDGAGNPVPYHMAENYIISQGGTISQACLHDYAQCPASNVADTRPAEKSSYQYGDVLCSPDFRVKYVFGQALSVTEVDTVDPEEVLGAVSGVGGDDILVAIMTQFIKSSVTLQVIMVVFMTGVMVDVVTAFALAILPIVFFYRFLPMSDKVRLGDYGGAAFALLAMPLVASLVMVAGSGAVASIAVDSDFPFSMLFVWLSALSVVLLVIGIPATMVPLIGAATQQATAAIQTGVQTAQFAATATAATAGGAIRGTRAGREYTSLSSMKPGSMSPFQAARLEQLKSSGQTSMARAALMGGMGGLRGQMVGSDGSLTSQFRNVVTPGTQNLTAASVQGLGGFQTGTDATRDAAAISGMVGQAGMTAAQDIASQKTGPPSKQELLDESAKRVAEAKARMDVASERAGEAAEGARNTPGYEVTAASHISAERLAATENGNKTEAENRMAKLGAKRNGMEAKKMDLQSRGMNAEASALDDTINRTNAEISKLKDEVTRAGEAMENHMAVARAEMSYLVRDAQTGHIGGAVGQAILAQHMAKMDHINAQDNLDWASAGHSSLAKEVRDEKWESGKQERSAGTTPGNR